MNTYCYKCSIQLHFITKKIHCFYCKNIFCYNCLEYKKYLTDNKKKTICHKCYIYHNEIKELKDIILRFYLLPLTLQDYYTLSKVCITWNVVYKHYINKLSKLYNKLPYLKLNNLDVNILYSNQSFISGHNFYIVKLLLSISNKSIHSNNENKIITTLRSNKTICCKSLHCHSNCKAVLSAKDIIQCLYYNIRSFKIIKILLEQLKNKKSSISYIQNYIFIFVHILQYYKYNHQILELFTSYLFELSNKDIHFCNTLFWDLTYNIKNIIHAQFYATIRKKLIDSLHKRTYNIILNSHDFTKNLIELIKSDHTSFSISKNIQRHLINNEYKINDYLYIPINLNKKICKINASKVKILQSKTKPILIPCIHKEDNVEKNYTFMLKPEDLRKEYIIMNIIKIIDNILKTELDLDLHIVTYNILPISEKFGFIEFISNAYTIYDIKEEEKFSIQNFIIEKNPTITACELRENFSKSCAAYCVITYLLGIGDRHLENIMITKEGYIFNIDFGYVLGLDPKLLSPKFRLTTEMIDAMGGLHSKYFENFKQYCTIAFNCLRKHVDLFYILILQLTYIISQESNKKFTLEHIKKYIEQRFIPHKPNFNASIEFKYIIFNNSNTYSGSMIDYFHKKYKRLSKSSKSSKSSTTPDTTQEPDQKNSSVYTSAINVFSGAQSSFKKMFSSS
jgi:hypothetical protein